MRGARGSEVALPATRITKGGKAGSGSKGSAKKKQPEAGPPAFGWKPSISRSGRLPERRRENSPSAYLTGAFTGGGKGSA